MLVFVKLEVEMHKGSMNDALFEAKNMCIVLYIYRTRGYTWDKELLKRSEAV